MSDNQTVPEPEQDVEGHVQMRGPEGFPGGDPDGFSIWGEQEGSSPEPEGVVGQPTVKRRIDRSFR